MRGENNIFVRYLKTVPAPWHHKIHNPGSNHRQDVIVDYTSREICTLKPYDPAISVEQYRRTVDLITLAPELLAACIEFAFMQDQAGNLTEELAKLIHDAGGPDIRDRVKPPTTPATTPTPPTDNVLRTKTKKGRRLPGNN